MRHTDILALILGGGDGTRLYPLIHYRTLSGSRAGVLVNVKRYVNAKLQRPILQQIPL